MKQCITCNEIKELSEFRNRNSCKKCESTRRYELKKKQKKDPEWYEKYKKQDAERMKRKRNRGDEMFNFVESIRGLVRKSFTNKNYTKNSKTFDILGIDQEGLFEHIEKQFKDGMTWENHSHRGWHIDHIIPVNSATSYEELVKLNHYTNLQPLWCDENWKKSDKIL